MSALARVRAGGRSLDGRLAAVPAEALLAGLRAAGAVSEPEVAALGAPASGGWAGRLRALAVAKGDWTCGVLLSVLRRLEGPPRPGPFDFYDPQRDAAPAHRSDCPCCRPEPEWTRGEEEEEEEGPKIGDEGREEEEEENPKNEEGDEGHEDDEEGDEGQEDDDGGGGDEGHEDDEEGDEGHEDDDGGGGDEGHEEEEEEEPENGDEGPEDDDDDDGGGDEGPENDGGDGDDDGEGGDEGPEDDDDGGGGDED